MGLLNQLAIENSKKGKASTPIDDVKQYYADNKKFVRTVHLLTFDFSLMALYGQAYWLLSSRDPLFTCRSNECEYSL